MQNQSDKELTPKLSGHQDVSAELGNGPTQQHAADVARSQISNIYGQNGEPEPKKQENPYNQTHVENFDWRKYHSAWQEYYQEYYKRYYEQQPSAEQPQTSIISGGVEPQPSKIESLKSDVRSKVKERAHKFKRSSHFLPVVSALVVGLAFLFLQFNGLLFAQVRAYVSPGELEGKSVVITNPGASLEVGPEPRMIIPKINVDVPIIYDETSLNEGDIQEALQDGVVHYKLPGADSVPGERGNAAFLGHSSNDVFAGGEYKFAFLLADNLVPGDTFFLHYEGIRYTYKVTEKKVINPDEVSTLQIGYDKPIATLITCTPPGTALKRLLVFAEQISPDPAAATQPAETAPTDDSQTIPGNAPTLFEQIFGIFF